MDELTEQSLRIEREMRKRTRGLPDVPDPDTVTPKDEILLRLTSVTARGNPRYDASSEELRLAAERAILEALRAGVLDDEIRGRVRAAHPGGEQAADDFMVSVGALG